MDAELRFHVEAHVQDLIRSGVRPEEARRRARIEFGGIERAKEECRDATGANLFDSLLQDIRLVFRQLRKSPGFSTLAILILALGIGANTAIFSLLDQAVLRKLSVAEPDRLVLLRHTGINGGHSFTRTDEAFYFSYPMYRDLRDKNSIFSGLLATAWTQVGIQWRNEPDIVNAELVSGNYFEVLGLQPALGRLFFPSDDVASEANPVAVLSFDFWQRRFASDPLVINQSVLINGHPFTVVGVTRPGFRSIVSGDVPALFLPMMMKPQATPGWNDLNERKSIWLNIAGRLNASLDSRTAQAGADALWHSLRASELTQRGHNSQRFIDSFLNNSHLFLVDGSKGVPPAHGSTPSTLLVTMGMAGLLILMACANVGTLLLVRAAGRSREISVRLVLGASRNRVLRQLLTEGLILGLAGGLAGIFIAPPIAAILLRTISPANSSGFGFSSQMDCRALLFNFALVLLVSVLASLAPVHQFWRPDLTPALQQRREGYSRSPLRLRRVLVVAQISLSILLLVGAGLLIRTMRNLQSVPVGFATDHLVTFSVDPLLAGYEADRTERLYRELLDRLAHLPGVRSAAASNDPELADSGASANITIAGYHAADDEDMNVEMAKITPEFFTTLGTPLLAGRELSEQDRLGSTRVAVVNESFARRFFGSPQEALGTFFCQGAGDVTPDIQVIGVAGDVLHTSLRDRMRPAAFLPLFQTENQERSFGMFFYVRTWQTPEAAEPAIRQSVHSLDSKLALDNFRTMQEQVDENLASERMVAFLASCFGLLAAFMAAIGIYGVLAYSIAQRNREFAVRIAVGATPANIIRIVVADVLWLVACGILAGVPLAMLCAQALRSQLFGVSKSDPLIWNDLSTTKNYFLSFLFAFLEGSASRGRGGYCDG